MSKIEISKYELAARKDDFRAKNSKLKKSGRHIPSKLDVGSCFRKPEGYWGTDIYPFTGVDQVFDHTKYPWPLPENHFEEIRLWHIMQYFPDIDQTMKELWRIAKDRAKIIIGVPYFMSSIAFGDRNKSFFTENTFKAYTENSWYQEQADTFTENARFSIKNQILRATGKWRKYIPLKRFLSYFLWNIYDELEVHLIVHKKTKIQKAAK